MNRRELLATTILLCCAFTARYSTVASPITSGVQDDSSTVAVIDADQTTVKPVEATIAETTVQTIEPVTESTVPTVAATETIAAATEATAAATETVTEAVETTAVTVETTAVAVETVTEAVETVTEATETVTEATETVAETTETVTEATETTTAESTKIVIANATAAEVVKDKLSEQIRKILRHYQRPDPTGFPGAPIPDPLSIPPMKKLIAATAEMTFYNMTVHGLSKFKLDRVDTDLDKMQVNIILKIERLYIFGNYTLQSWLMRSTAGPFNVTLMDVEVEAAAVLVPDEDGNLQADEMEMDMRFDDCVLDFKNLGLTGTIFQSAISSLGSMMFEGVKPFIITEVNNNMKTDVNAQVKAITSKLPKLKVPVVDLAMAEGRSYVRRMGFDPYCITGRTIKEGPLNFTITDLTVSGLSDFRRVGDVGLQVRGPVLQMIVHVVTGPVNGSLRWRYELGLIRKYGRSGVSNFTVEHIQVRAVVNQTLDIRNKPVVDSLEMEVGNITMKMDRREPLDYVIEVAINSLPSLLRHIIVDSLEEPIKMKIQTLLDDVQVEKLVEERLPELDRLVGD